MASSASFALSPDSIRRAQELDERSSGSFAGHVGAAARATDLRASVPAPAIDGFRALDDLVRSRDAAGFVVVRGAAGVLDAVALHVDRRARAIDRSRLRVSSASADDVWREVAARVGAFQGRGVLADPVATAAAIAAAAGDAVLIVSDFAPTDWGSAIASELARLAGSCEDFRPLVVLLTERGVRGAQSSEIAIDAAASPEHARLWWEALSGDAHVDVPARGLEALERWWSVARATPPDSRRAAPALSQAAGVLLDRVVLAQRSWPLDHLDRLGPRTALPELVAARVVEVDPHGRVAACGALMAPAELDAVSARVVAEALEDLWAHDPWAAARASELYAAVCDADRAEASAVRALVGVTDAAARGDFWRRWESSLEALPVADAAPRLLRSADLALRVGDVDRALGFARAAAASASSAPAGEALGFEVMLTLGRATAARGDLTTAAIALVKAMDRAPSAACRARAEVEVAEVRYSGGDLDAAELHARAALADAADGTTRLLARNVLGKLHLAAARWAEAEEHFAADACDAACASDSVAELRARLNRAIALISSGRRDQARSMLHAVLEDGQRAGELRAIAAAYSNLAAIATWAHDYPEALRLWESAIEARRSVGEKIMLARTIVNLAELRLRVGLVAEAEQALLFGRQACPAIPAARAADFALVAARIHLARGRTLLAHSEIASAIAGASGSSDGAMLCDCYRVAARIALEDGDVARAEQAIAKAREEAARASVGARADVAVLHALRARAAGEVFGEQAGDALELAREADDGELMREAHVLLHHAAVLEGDRRGARAHADAALMLRNRIAGALSGDLRERFLARRELAELARIEAAIADEPVRNAESRHAIGSDRPRAAATSSERRIVGDDPAMLALLAAVQKVGPSDATVLIHGESGTGKELVAEALHEASSRRAGPLVKVNCAALVETLLLSELFGHEKGSFTGAGARRRGRFELAEGGTLFLDEIGDISPRTQVALLRVLQDKMFERVGGVTPIRANVRIVCATHRDLKAMVARGEFREDLYYRLRGVVLDVPALRNRVRDLPLIANAILDRIGDERRTVAKRLSPRAADCLARHAWPGNVRELENALRAAALFAEGELLEADDFTTNVDGLRHLEVPPPSLAPVSLGPETVRVGGAPSTIPPPPLTPLGMRAASLDFGAVGPSGSELSSAATPTAVAYAHVRQGVSLHDMKRQIEEECIARALSECKGNITRAAALLGMKRPRLSQLVKQYGLGGASDTGVDSDSGQGEG